MPTNINEAVWTSGQVNHTGGGNDALILIPHDIDVVDVAIEVAAATTAQVQVTHDSREDVVGISERPLRYAEAAINDLGGSGELRINAGSSLDFTDDGWAIGDTFEVISHVIPDFNDPNRVGGKPTSLGDVQIYTVTSVATKVLAFSEDPGYSLVEGEVVVALSRAAVAEDSLNWADVGAAVVGADTAHINLGSAGNAVRVIATAGVAAIDYEFRARHQSVKRGPSFIANVESRPFAGYAANPLIPLAGAPDDSVVTWDEVVTGGPNASRRQARMTIAGADFQQDGLQRYDRVFVGGHSETDNGGQYMVDSRVATAITFKEPLRGSPGTDTPGRVKLRYAPTTLLQADDYTELVLQHATGSLDLYYPCQDGVPNSLVSIASGTNTITNFGGVAVDDGPGSGPFSTSHAYSEPSDSEWEDGNFNSMLPSSQPGGMEGWFRMDSLSAIERHLMRLDSRAFIIGVTAGEEVYMDLQGDALADPGTWVTATEYFVGDRVRPSSDNLRVYECETLGASAAGEPTFPTDGSTVTDGVAVAGWQDGDYGGALTGGTATGLANDATVYTAAVVVDGGSSEPISIVGSAAQTYTTLMSELDTDTTATWTIVGGELRATSPTTGATSTIAITDTDLLATLTTFVSLNTAITGSTGLVWRDVGTRADFDRANTTNGERLLSGVVMQVGDWVHVAAMRPSDGTFRFYVNGVKVGTLDGATGPGSFGSPVRFDFTSSAHNSGSTDLMSDGSNGAHWNGGMSHLAYYDENVLTDAQVLSHYDKAVELGLN